MRKVGIMGGSLLCELGTSVDIHLFFDCINTYVISKHPKQDWSLLADRLYKRYLRLNELDEASILMEKVRQIFTALPSNAVDWTGYEEGKNKTKNHLDSTRSTLAEIFEKYFYHFSRCVESSKNSYEIFKLESGYKYEPVQLIISDIPWFTVENNRPLEEYDSLKGPPFWASTDK